MKALTAKAPWAQAIVFGDKRIENRTWRPHKDIVGQRIAIHCGKSLADDGDCDDARYQRQLGRAWVEVGLDQGLGNAGRIIGTARVIGWHYDFREVAEQDTLRVLDFPLSDEWKHLLRGYMTVSQGIQENPWWLGPIGWRYLGNLRVAGQDKDRVCVTMCQIQMLLTNIPWTVSLLMATATEQSVDARRVRLLKAM